MIPVSCHRTAAAGLLAALTGIHAAAAADPAPFPTPELARADVRIDRADGTTGIGATAPFPPGVTAHRVGIILLCSDHVLEAHLSLGGIPARKPLQLAVVTPDNDTHRFGPVFTGGPRSGFHDPVITDPRELSALVPAVFRYGSLVSNGHISFRNRMTPGLNQEFLDFARDCRGR